MFDAICVKFMRLCVEMNDWKEYVHITQRHFIRTWIMSQMMEIISTEHTGTYHTSTSLLSILQLIFTTQFVISAKLPRVLLVWARACEQREWAKCKHSLLHPNLVQIDGTVLTIVGHMIFDWITFACELWTSISGPGSDADRRDAYPHQSIFGKCQNNDVPKYLCLLLSVDVNRVVIAS